MDNFDIKKFLTENKLTKKYQFLEESKITNQAVNSYLATALWTSTGDDGDDLDAKYEVSDVSKESVEASKRDLEAFYKKSEKYLEDVEESKWAHDFWLNRNGHGTGFWDGDYEHGDALTAIAETFKEVDLYVGDDGKIHMMGETIKEEEEGHSTEDTTERLRTIAKHLKERCKKIKEQENVSESEMSYDKKLALANNYLENMVGLSWDDLSDINSLHDAETIQDIKEFCDERLEEEGFSDMFENEESKEPSINQVLASAVEEADLNAKELAEAISAIVEELYGSHNYEDFKSVVNRRLK